MQEEKDASVFRQSMGSLQRGGTRLSAVVVTQMFVFCIQMCNRKLSSSPLLKQFCIPRMQEPDGVLSLS